VEAEVVMKPAAIKDAEKIILFCREHLLPYKIPQRLVFVEEISKTATGKIRRT
jgi:acyl-coenzyme A synthetase/AMP-(fatty) acid ligase